MRRLTPTLLLLAWIAAAGCEAQDGTAGTPAASPFDHDHADWTRLLERHVSQGRLDYAALHRDPSGLDAYLAQLESVRPEQYSRWSRAERLAFWINAYNAYTVKLILNHYPVDSIKDIGGLFKSPFKSRFIPLEWLRGGRVSLDEIEHGILRTDFEEPRIHFAIVCASVGCPPLAGRAYRARDLEAQLARQTRRFLGDSEHNRYDADRSTLYLSSIFKWFRSDFEAASGSLQAFVQRHGPPELTSALDDDTRIRFLDYDWSLNAHESSLR